MDELAPCTVAIIVVTVYYSWQGFNRADFCERFMFIPRAILADKQYYRLVTSGLLHGGTGHLFFNMFALYSFGSAVELGFGWARFLVIYLAGIVCGNLLSLYLHRHHDYRALGASGGVCGIVFASIFLFPGGSILIMFIPFPIPAWLFAIAFMLISYYGIRANRDNIGHDAHLAGAIFGLLVTTAFEPRIVTANPILYPVVMGLAIVIFLLLLRQSGAHLQLSEMMAEWKRDAGRTRALQDDQELDELLDKVSRNGIESLTRKERNRLKQISGKK